MVTAQIITNRPELMGNPYVIIWFLGLMWLLSMIFWQMKVYENKILKKRNDRLIECLKEGKDQKGNI